MQPYLLLYVGRLVGEKCVNLLIEAFRQLSTKRSDIGLVIVGGGPERERSGRLAQGMPTHPLRRVFKINRVYPSTMAWPTSLFFLR